MSISANAETVTATDGSFVIAQTNGQCRARRINVNMALCLPLGAPGDNDFTSK